MTDAQIVQLFLMRQEDALTCAQQKYGRYCHYIAENILGSPEDGEEVLSDTLHAAWNSIPPQQPENLKTYLGKLAREIAISRWRRNHAGKRLQDAYAVSLEELQEIGSDEEFSERFSGEELAGAISAFLRTLPADRRNLFLRRYWYGDSIAQLAGRFRMGQSNVKVTLYRTRESLRKYLQEEGFIV